MLMILMNYFPVKIIKILSEHKKIFLWLALTWTAMVTFLCLVKFDNIPKVSVSNFDKLGHFTFHYGMTAFWFLYYKFQKTNSFKKSLVKGFAFSVVYGIIIEFIQAFCTKTRNGDLFDVFANMTGSIAAVLTAVLLMKVARNLKSD